MTDLLREATPVNYWLHGAYIGCGSFVGTRARFTSDREELALKVAQHMHERARRVENSYTFKTADECAIGSLTLRGIMRHRHNRNFPQLEERLLHHFIRGFYDAKGTIIRDRKSINLRVHFGEIFLQAMHNKLATHAGVQRSAPSGKVLVYGHRDTLRISDYLYQDSDHIELDIYTESLKSALDTAYSPIDKAHLKLSSKKRIKKAVELLAQHKSIAEIRAILGYKHPATFARAYRKIVGENPQETQDRFIAAHAKDMLDRGKSIDETVAALRTHRNTLNSLFKRTLGTTAGAYIRSRQDITQTD